ARWNELANAALRDPKVRDQISALDYDIRGGTAPCPRRAVDGAEHDIAVTLRRARGRRGPDLCWDGGGARARYVGRDRWGPKSVLDHSRSRRRGPRRGRADRLFLDERARGPAAVEDVRGCRRRKSELYALVRFDHSVA